MLVNGASGITGIGTVLSALAMGAPLIIAVARNPARLERNLLTVLTVLAKSSGRVYLRDKEPNLAAIRPGRRVVLVIPPGWGAS